MRKGTTLLLAIIASALVTATAFSAWTNSQNGTGTAKVTAAGTYTLTADLTGPPAAEYMTGPGTNGSATVTITNTSNTDLTLTSYAGVGSAGSGITVTGAGPSCSTSNFIPNPNPQTVSVPIPANATTTVDLHSVISLSAQAPVSCAGATVGETVTVTLVS